jgi:hypothetical protein
MSKEQQRARRQRLGGQLRGLLVAQAGQGLGLGEQPGGDLHLQHQLQRGGRLAAAGAAGEEVGRAVGQADAGGVAEEDAVEAAQQRQQGGLGGQAAVEGLGEQRGEEIDGPVVEALLEGVVRDVDAEVLGGEVGQVLQRGGRLLEQGEDQRLGEGAAAQKAPAPAEAGVLGQPVGGVVEQVVQGGVQFRYTDGHGRLRGLGGSWRTHPIPGLPFRSFRYLPGHGVNSRPFSLGEGERERAAMNRRTPGRGEGKGKSSGVSWRVVERARSCHSPFPNHRR